MSTHEASPAIPTSPVPVRPKPLQALVGLLVLLGVMGVVAKGAVGWARNFGILPYTGPIISEATIRDPAWDPLTPFFGLTPTAEPHRGPERYVECGFRVRVFSGSGAEAKHLAMYENHEASEAREKRVVPGPSGIPVPLRFRDDEAIALLRGSGEERVHVVVDELRGAEVVKEGLISTPQPIDWHAWDREHNRRNLPPLAVTLSALLAFGKEAGMVESWEETESEYWRYWHIAPSFRQKQEDSKRIANRPYIGVTCDATGAVRDVGLVCDFHGDADYLTELLKLPESERSLRHAAHARQVLADLPAIVHRFLLVAAPEQADEVARTIVTLAAQTPAQFVTGVNATGHWSATLAAGQQQRVTVAVAAGLGVIVGVDSRVGETTGLAGSLEQ